MGTRLYQVFFLQFLESAIFDHFRWFSIKVGGKNHLLDIVVRAKNQLLGEDSRMPGSMEVIGFREGKSFLMERGSFYPMTFHYSLSVLHVISH